MPFRPVWSQQRVTSAWAREGRASHEQVLRIITTSEEFPMMIGVDREAFALQVMKEVRRWPGVQIRPLLNPTSTDPDDGVEFRLYGRQIGHIHHDCSVHLSFTRTLKQMVLEQGRALPLEQAGGVGWVAFVR